MNLSIFNFNKMTKIILIFVVLFAGYNIYLILAKPEISMYQNQQQGNISKVQNYIYGKKYDVVIVGSSLANTMKQSFFNYDIYNLAFSGGSSLSGLELIKKSGRIPKAILIESNIIFQRDIDDSMIDKIYQPILWKIKRYIPALREKYQPLNIVATFLKNTQGKSHNQRMKDKRNQKVFENSMKLMLKSIDEPLANFEHRISALKRLVSYFESHGVKVCFFELPVEKEIQHSLKYEQTKDILLKSKYNFVELFSDSLIYETSDGIHLIYSSAYKISNEIEKVVSGTNK